MKPADMTPIPDTDISVFLVSSWPQISTNLLRTTYTVHGLCQSVSRLKVITTHIRYVFYKSYYVFDQHVLYALQMKMHRLFLEVWCYLLVS